ncbi:MAG: hypothetical protein RMK29_08825 [Myxococcales bacterium]|nr:hypothetical protein [Myxococcota bacterium]MDW8281800.1 hypothetical protein [Myxococcales bacterium]
MATIPLNLWLCLLVGLGLSACARTQLRTGAWPWRSDLLVPVLSFALLSAAPVATYLYLVYPDWSWMYLVDPRRLPAGTSLAAVVLTVLMVPVGYFSGWLLLRLGGSRVLFGAIGAATMGMLLLLVLCRRRLLIDARFEDFHQGLLRPITQGKLALALLCTAPPLWGAAFVVGRSLWGQGRWLRQQAAMTSSRSGHAAGSRSQPHGLAPEGDQLRSLPSS